MLGQTVSHYRIEALLGEGAAGAVYRASDLNLPGHQVAIKAIKPTSQDDRQAYQRFLREARALVQIEHPNVVDLHEVVEQDGHQFLVMQYVEGETLRAHLQSGRFEVERALDLAVQMADGLQAAHEGGVIHRDVKPENMTVTPEGRLKVMDFGIARHVERTQMTVDGALMGTIPYMAPEQIEGGEITPATDVYAVGVVLYEMLGGALPFQADTRRRLMHLVLDETPRNLREVRPELSADLCRAVHRCLEKNPERRPSSMAELSQVLRTLRSGDWLTQVLPRLARRRRNLWSRRLVPVSVLVAALALILIQVRPCGTPPEERARIMVLPFDNQSEREDLDWLAGAISDVLVAQLNQLGDYEVVSSQTVSSALRHLEVREAGVNFAMLRQVADRVGARYLLAGSFAERSGRTQLSCELTDLARDAAVGRWNRAMDDIDRDLLTEVREIARGVAQSLDARRTESANPDAVELTRSVDALRHFQQGEDHFERAHYSEARDAFAVAVAIDSTFAAAHLWLAELSRDPAVAQGHLGQAMRFREDYLPPLPRLIEGEFYQSQGYVEQATEAYEEVVREFPLHVSAQRLLGNIYLRSGRYDDATRLFARLHRTNPYDYSLHPHWWQALFNLGDVEQARKILTEWRRERPDDPAAVRALMRFHYNAGEYRTALAECDTIAQMGEPELAMRGFLLMTLGRMSDARAIFERMRDHPDPRYSALRARTYLAQLDLRMENYDEARTHINAALADVNDTYNHWVAGRLAAAAGDVERAQVHAAAIARGINGDPADESVREAYGDRGWYFEVLGEMELARGAISRAVEEFQRSIRFFGRTQEPRLRAAIARAYLESSDYEDAARNAQAGLAIDPNHPGSLLRLGEAQLELGDVAVAKETLARLKSIWSEADEDFPAKRRLDELVARALADVRR